MGVRAAKYREREEIEVAVMDEMAEHWLSSLWSWSKQITVQSAESRADLIGTD